MNSPVLSARNLVKRYGELLALNEVAIDVAPGEAVAIMGASGSGKTTLLHCLAAIIAPDAGSILLRTDAAATPTQIVGMNESERSEVRRSRLGFVFQDHLLLPELSALENAALPLLLKGIARPQAEAHAAAWLAALGLGGMEQRRIGQLSGGQAQRVAIARAQVTGAPIVFADEPTGALDSRTSDEVMSALLHATVGQGRSLVVVTHDAGVAARCRRTLHMVDGRIVGETINTPAAPLVGPPSAQAVPATAHLGAGEVVGR